MNNASGMTSGPSSTIRGAYARRLIDTTFIPGGLRVRVALIPYLDLGDITLRLGRDPLAISIACGNRYCRSRVQPGRQRKLYVCVNSTKGNQRKTEDT